MGAHPKAPSAVVSEQGQQSLADLIEADPETILGVDTVRSFGPSLPFLFKVLASEKALAMQVHPTKDQAIIGFQRENGLGIHLGAAGRNYLDRNHNPEMLCALEPFWCLAGFRTVRDIAADLKSLHLSAIGENIDAFVQSRTLSGLRRLFSSIMLLNDERRKRFVREVVDKATVSKEIRHKWIVELNHQYPGDIGVVSPLFLALLHLRTGQAVYLGAGIIHAYLRGFGIELMSNSDNVVRGGLSVRHVDIPEFLDILDYNRRPIEPIDPQEVSTATEIYRTRISDFCLYRIRLKRGLKHVSARKRAVEILVCIEGEAVLGAGDDSIQIRKGESFLVPAAAPTYTLEGKGLLFKATVKRSRVGR